MQLQPVDQYSAEAVSIIASWETPSLIWEQRGLEDLSHLLVWCLANSQQPRSAPWLETCDSFMRVRIFLATALEVEGRDPNSAVCDCELSSADPCVENSLLLDRNLRLGFLVFLRESLLFVVIASVIFLPVKQLCNQWCRVSACYTQLWVYGQFRMTPCGIGILGVCHPDFLDF